MGIRAGCSRCEYTRSFALELRGLFYRCPRCREGVIAVGGEAATAKLPMPPPGSGSSHETPSPLVVPRLGVVPISSDEIPPGGAAVDSVGKVKRVLVECGLCGHHVTILPELFGKTVRCPECQGVSAFTESTLEPVKDEIMGRIAFDDFERRLLGRRIPAPVSGPEETKRRRRVQAAIFFTAGLVAAVVVLAASRC
jgi:hypothetical protein